MSTTDNSVPLPFVTELPPVTMEKDKSSPTLPETKSDKQPTLDPPINMTSVDGQAEPEVKETASSKYSTSGKGVSLISGDTVDHPISPKAPISPREFNFNRKDENEFQLYIAKAHTCVRQGHPTSSPDKDKDLTKLSEMVSQMTHLLAATGIGRETAARALAYMAGPEKAEPKAALREAKKDRRRKNNARRVPSGDSNKSAKANDASQEKEAVTTDKDTITTSESSNPPNTLETTTESGKSAKPGDEKPSSAATPAANATNDTDKAATTNGAGNGKKSGGRRRWWQRRNRRGNNQQDKAKENEGQGENASGNQENKEADGTAPEDDTKDKGKETPLESTTNAAATAA